MGNPKVTSGVITLKDQGDGSWGSKPSSQEGGGYAAFDVPIIYHSTTATSVPIKLVRRDGANGNLSVNVQASAKFNEQGVSAGLNRDVTFLDGEIVKNISLPLNNIVLDGEAHLQLIINSGPVQARFNEVHTIIIVDTGTIKAGSPVLTDPNADIIQDAIGDNTIVYVQNGDWNDPSTPGYVPRGQDGASAKYSSIDDVQNCIIRNYPGHSPRMVSPLDFTDPLLPTGPSDYLFYVTICDYVHIYGFEMVDRMGIYTREWVDNVDRRFNNTYLHFHSNHCHDIYGDDNHENVGCIRLDDDINAVVFNNLMHDTYDCRTYPFDNGVNAIPYNFNAGVHGYRPVDCYIYQNTIYNVLRGVYQKQPNLTQENSNAVFRNLIYTATKEAVSYEHAGSVGPALNNALVAENVTLNSDLVRAFMFEGIAISTNMTVRNNTTINAFMTDLDSIDGVTIYNNLIDNPPAALTWSTNGNRVYSTTYDYIDNDGYPDENIRFLVDRDAGLPSYDSVPLFRTATSTEKTILPPTGQEDNSITGAPLFTNPVANDYSLQPGSPYIGSGRYGLDIGAYYTDPQIGATI